MLAAGLVLLGAAAFIMLNATIFQARATNSLEREVRMFRIDEIKRPRPVLKEGDLLGRVVVPRLGVSVAILQGTSSQILRLGAGHIEGTPLPGEAGNTGIAGHRDTFFRNLESIRVDDEIQLHTATGLFVYKVAWVKVVVPENVGVLAPATESAVTLVTCYPFHFLGSAPKRFVVRAYRY
jgi:sortase A